MEEADCAHEEMIAPHPASDPCPVGCIHLYSPSSGTSGKWYFFLVCFGFSFNRLKSVFGSNMAKMTQKRNINIHVLIAGQSLWRSFFWIRNFGFFFKVCSGSRSICKCRSGKKNFRHAVLGACKKFMLSRY